MGESVGVPDSREEHLLQIRREAEMKGRVNGAGVRVAGAPFPMASPQHGYYEQPLLKEPQWTQLIPLYFFVGGAAGSLGVIGSVADVIAGEKSLAKKARWLALGGSALSAVLLVSDLGRPSRFLNMLRVCKPQSTMSMGSWVLSGFSIFASASSFADAVEYLWGLNGFVQLVRGMGRIGSVAFGMPFHNYTGVLLATTAVPVWNACVDSLPGHFGMSGLQAGASILELLGNETNRSLNLLGLLSASMETRDQFRIACRSSRTLLPLKLGSSGAIVGAGAWLSGPIPLLLRLAALLPGRHPTIRKLAACSGTFGSLLTRYGWLQAGKSSARDWRVPLEIGNDNLESTSDGAPPRKSVKPRSRWVVAKTAGVLLVVAVSFVAVRRKA